MSLSSLLSTQSKVPEAEVVGSWAEAPFFLAVRPHYLPTHSLASLSASAASQPDGCPQHSRDTHTKWKLVSMERVGRVSVGVFDQLGLLCLPLTGVYGHSYNPCWPIAVLQIQGLTQHQLGSCLPDSIAQALTLPLLPNNATSASILEADLFVTIATAPQRSVCQKFLCDNTDEVNLLFHTWIFGSTTPFLPTTTVSEQVAMGVFEPHGVRAVHQDLKDAGISFGALSERTVAIHSLSFSPENAQLQLTDEVPVAHFFSVARYLHRLVVTLHILPVNDTAEALVQKAVGKSSTVGELIANLTDADASAGLTLSQTLTKLFPSV